MGTAFSLNIFNIWHLNVETAKHKYWMGHENVEMWDSKRLGDMSSFFSGSGARQRWRRVSTGAEGLCRVGARAGGGRVDRRNPGWERDEHGGES